VHENLRVGAAAGRGAFTLDRVYELFPPLVDLSTRRGESLSGGEQQMLTIARTLMTDPRLLLLDEPSEGLAPVVVRALGDAIADLKARGLTILLSEQNVKFARRLADRAYVIERGEIKFAGAIAELDRDEALRRAYLGI
jgi:branched-chain amino acid transport system ATP-binding protein